MKRITMLVAAIMVAGAGFAQTDSTTQQTDTIKVGKFIIIKKNKGTTNQTGNDRTTTIEIDKRPRKPGHISTNWWIFDLGFANVKDETAYGSVAANNYLRAPVGRPFTKDDLKLRAGKTSNVNIWIFMQKLNLTKGVANLKYGLGLEMFNFRYENNISYIKNPTPTTIVRDSVDFSKNKLYAGYLTVPFMLNINTSPGRKKGLSFSAGISAGYLVGSHTKQISKERGKTKTKGELDLEQFRIAYIGELGLGPVRLFGSYSATKLHEKGLTQYPYSLGIRFSNW